MSAALFVVAVPVVMYGPRRSQESSMPSALKPPSAVGMGFPPMGVMRALPFSAMVPEIPSVARVTGPEALYVSCPGASCAAGIRQTIAPLSKTPPSEISVAVQPSGKCSDTVTSPRGGQPILSPRTLLMVSVTARVSPGPYAGASTPSMSVVVPAVLTPVRTISTGTQSSVPTSTSSM